MTQSINTIPKRSIKLTQDEKRRLNKYYKSFTTEVDCALSIGIDRNVLARVRQVGSGSEHTVSRIREALQNQN
jgi:hypothetical protein